jgi:FkbM family methyltransferase
MPATRMQRARVSLRTLAPWRRVWGDRTVRRSVQGVDLYLPWSHVLPDYARIRPYYGQNLVELAVGLERRLDADRPFNLLDIGANVGDSALQVLNRVEGRVLCVEGDPYWTRYLRMNTDADPRVTIEEALLTPTDDGWGDVDAVRGLGTSKLVPATEGNGGTRAISVPALRGRHPEFADVRLIKSDTDGFDPLLAPAAARTWSESDPVLFFEYDPTLAREVSGEDPTRVWDELAELGYSRLLVWDNTGDPLGALDLADAAAAAAELEPRPLARGDCVWDVAACRDDDASALETFAELMRGAYAP